MVVMIPEVILHGSGLMRNGDWVEYEERTEWDKRAGDVAVVLGEV
jgi:hypothetical protein